MLPFDVLALMSRSTIRTLFDEPCRNTVKGANGLFFPQRYGTCPCLLTIQVSRLRFSCQAGASTLSIVATCFPRPKLLPAGVPSQLTKAAAPDSHTFTLAAETEKSE